MPDRKIVGTEKDLKVIYNTQPTGWVGHYGIPTFEPEYGHNFPFFRKTLVPTIKKDPRIRYALNLLKGPIQAHTVFLPEKDAQDPALHETIREQGIQFVFAVKSKDSRLEELIIKTLNRFWLCGLQEALLAIDWGFSCSQIIYQKVGKEWRYDSLQHLHPFNVSPMSQGGRLHKVRVKGVPGFVGGLDLPAYRAFWHVHCKEYHKYWGQSRLEWAFVPWHETWTQYGARDIRRTWFYRNSYDGGTMRYPIGKTRTSSGTVIDNIDLAIEMLAQIKTGGFRVLPNELGPDGKTQNWDYEPPSANITPQGLMEYPSELRLEILEAMGIPPEVVESSSDGGFGSATGRKVPLLVYYASLFPLASNVVEDVLKFIVNPLASMNYQVNDPDYEVYRVVPLKSQQKQPPGGGPPKKTDQVTKTETDTGLSV